MNLKYVIATLEEDEIGGFLKTLTDEQLEILAYELREVDYKLNELNYELVNRKLSGE